MKAFLALTLILSSLSAGASTLLECHAREGKFDVRNEVVGNLVLDGSKATFYSGGSITNFNFVVREVTRTGTWLNFEYKNIHNDVARLVIEESGAARKSFISVESEDGDVTGFISMKCNE